MLFGPTLAILLLASPPPEQMTPLPEVKAAKSYDDQMRELPKVLHQYGLSDAGIRVVVDGIRSEQAEIANVGRRVDGPLNAFVKAAESPHFNPKRFEAALRRYKAAQAAVRTISTDYEIAVFRALSPADQKVMARLMAGSNGVMIGMPIRSLRKAPQ